MDDVARALEGSGLPPSSLVLEMTESVLLDDDETVLDILRQLKQLGYFGRPMEADDMERLLGDELAATRTAAVTD